MCAATCNAEKRCNLTPGNADCSFSSALEFVFRAIPFDEREFQKHLHPILISSRSACLSVLPIVMKLKVDND
jgi:hypothetical protein